MKFGKLMRATVDARMPQWREHVVQYKHLKQVIKKAHQQAMTQGARPPRSVRARCPRVSGV